MKAAKRRVAIVRDTIYALRDEQGHTEHNMDDITKIVERFYTRLYASGIGPAVTTESTSIAWRSLPLVGLAPLNSKHHHQLAVIRQ